LDETRIDKKNKNPDVALLYPGSVLMNGDITLKLRARIWFEFEATHSLGWHHVPQAGEPYIIYSPQEAIIVLARLRIAEKRC